MSELHSVKIDIIGGFLGAGKTTFLNKLLHDGLKSERVVIIENEFGDEPVDDAVLDSAGIEMRTLPSGCICCTLKADFMTSIEDIVARCNPDRILIEPTGLASPTDLRATCELAARIPDLAADVRLNSITAIVDATDAVEMIEYEMPVYIHQIDQANVIVLSHVQELDKETLTEAIAAIRQIAPASAIIVDAPWDRIDALEILALSEQALAEQGCADISRAVGDEDLGHDRRCEHTHERGDELDGEQGEGDTHEHSDHDGHDRRDGHAHCHHHSYEGFVSHTREMKEPFDDEAINRLTASLKARGIVRAKGFLPDAGGGLIHYEYVNGRATYEPTSYDNPAKLVTIGRS